MLELRVDFRSSDGWRAWAERNRESFARWRSAILDDVKRFGVIEPLSGSHHPPRSIAIDPAHLRESVSAREMNSRKRAGLLALQLAHRRLPPDRQHGTKILGAEAITRAARILRGAFPHFIGGEYLPTDEEKEKHYPIPHLDLTDAAFPDAAFDLFYSGDVLEHVPDLERALAEVARVLRPGGSMVSTFPFNPYSERTERRASLGIDGGPIHHLPPEYHGNPARPAEGSLVFFSPGWDVLDLAKAAGFADAKMMLVLSSAYGIVSAPVPGIFVFLATRAPVAPPSRSRNSDTFNYQGPRLRRVIGLAGLARSGTTLLCSVLGVHSDIHAVYEPFNANKGRELPPKLGIDRFLTEFATDMGGKETLLVKETGTQLTFLDRTADLLRSVGPPMGSDLIILLRNPLHSFLSMLEAQKKWWGGDHVLTAEAFETWARHNLAAMRRLLQLGSEFNAVSVSYEGLVADKERVIPELMDALDLKFEECQLDFEKFVDRRQVRGDITIATDPSAISDVRVRERAAELATAEEMIRQAPHYPRVAEVAKLVARLEGRAAARIHAEAEIVSALRNILSD